MGEALYSGETLIVDGTLYSGRDTIQWVRHYIVGETLYSGRDTIVGETPYTI